VVMEAVLLDPRMGRNAKVPGPDHDFGFGGKYLPKDLRALIHWARENGTDPHLLTEIWRFNLEVRNDRDWERIPGDKSALKF